MYKITLLFESDIEGVYTQEIETADCYNQMQRKYNRMLSRWFGYICPNTKLENDSNENMLNKILTKIDELNNVSKHYRNRTFDIRVEKYENINII